MIRLHARRKAFLRNGFKDLQEMWPIFAPLGESPAAYVRHSNWRHVPTIVTVRNELVRDERVHNLIKCREKTEQMLIVLRVFQVQLKQDIGFDGWSRIPARIKSTLAWRDA